jgi:hypothetical protein
MDGHADRLLDGGTKTIREGAIEEDEIAEALQATKGNSHTRFALIGGPIAVEPRPLPWQRTPEGLPPRKTAARSKAHRKLLRIGRRPEAG